MRLLLPRASVAPDRATHRRR